MTLAVSCESCGMPLAGAEDHALADTSIPFCFHCAPEGTLPPFEERLERFTQWMLSRGETDHAAAREKALAYMKTMPAWKDAD
ncbi:MAG TPA: zinc ribbon domain-containing protein [Candidatus Limnocylindrales bacterium]